MLNDPSIRDVEDFRQILGAIAETSSDAILLVDAEGRVVFGNPAVEEVFGYTSEELLGQLFFTKLAPEWTRTQIVEGLARFGEHGHEDHLGKAWEVVLLRKDGSEFRGSLRMSAGLSMAGRSFAVSVIRDLSRWAQAQQTTGDVASTIDEKLVRTEKLASIGQLAAGVAHEINNPVGFITSNLGTLKEYVRFLTSLVDALATFRDAAAKGDPGAQAEALDRIAEIERREELAYVLRDIGDLLDESLDGSHRVRDIVNNLQAFARLDEDEGKEADINAGIEATIKVVWNELKYRCTIHKELGPLPSIHCRPGQLNQVFMNLLVNAAQAIEERGDVAIRTEATVDEVIVHIADSGCGIPSEAIPRIFDPFYTTKDVGQGTGLGLWIAHGIVRKHGGTIDVESELGHGTTFTVRLPRDRKDGP